MPVKGEIANSPPEVDFAEPIGLNGTFAHDLRQKLQTLILLQNMLAGIVVEERAVKLVRQIEVATDAMADLLASLSREQDAPQPRQSEKSLPHRLSVTEYATPFSADLQNHGSEAGGTETPTVFVVDDDTSVRMTICEVLNASGYATEDFGDAFSFLKAYPVDHAGCILIDACMPEMDGFDLMRRVSTLASPPNGIMMTGHGDVSMAVKAMRAGAIDFLEKPFGKDELLTAIKRAIDPIPDAGALSRRRVMAQEKMSLLTSRQRQVLDRVLLGHSSKNIAEKLSISQRTVDNHRAAIMRKAGVRSLPALLRVAVTATAD